MTFSIAGIRSVPLLTALLATVVPSVFAQSGSGTSTRYWDCCKPSCAWNDLSTLGIDSAVISCDINDTPLASTSIQSACDDGTAFMCSSQVPWAISATEAYGFAAVSASESECCQCYQLTFTSTSLATSGKTMIVQATNTGGDVGSTQFDIAMPGGGFGIYDGCTQEWGATTAVWGQQYGGSTTDTCSQFPSKLQAGCEFRWGWFEGADNPTVDYEMVACPAAITDISGCVRTGDTPTGPASVATWTSGAASPTSTGTGTGTGTGTTTSSAATSTSTGSSGTSSCAAAEYAQCGGTGFTGCGSCVSGTTCQVVNEYYSQCQ